MPMDDEWIKLELYCARTGETEKAVRRRREEGIWLDGIHTQVRQRRLWVNYPRAQEWVKNGMVSRSRGVSR